MQIAIQFFKSGLFLVESLTLTRKLSEIPHLMFANRDFPTEGFASR